MAVEVDVSPEVTPYSVVLVNRPPEPGSGNISVLGSGTLVQVGRLRGLLTAAHVLTNPALPETGEVGIMIFPNRAAVQSRRFLIEHCEKLTISSSPLGPASLDVGFLRFSDAATHSLVGSQSFLNLDHQEAIFADLPKYDETDNVLFGGVEEWTEQTGKSRAELTSLMLAGNVERRPGIGNLVFRRRPGQSLAIPLSYGGVSGGGVWRLFFSRAEVVAKRLVGVAFWQESSSTILCQHLDAIYLLRDAARHRWPDEVTATDFQESAPNTDALPPSKSATDAV